MYFAYTVFGISSIGGLFSDKYIDAAWSFNKFLDLLSHLWLPIGLLGVTGTAGTIRAHARQPARCAQYAVCEHSASQGTI